MAELHRTRTAEEDLQAIWSYLAEQSPSAADRLLSRIDQVCQLLARNPQMGELVEYTRPGIRRITTGSYVIYFKPLGDGVLVHRVLHGARQWEDLV